MTASGTAVFTNPDEYGAGFGDASVNVFLTGRGDFKARLTWLKLRHLHLFRCREDVPSIAYISLAPLRSFVSFPLPSSSPPIWNGVKLQLGDIVLHSRGECAHRWTKGACQWALVSVPPNQLAHYCRVLAEADLTDRPVGRILRPHRDMAMRLRRLLSKACNLAETTSEIFAHLEAARALEQEFIHALVNCLTADNAYNSPASRQRQADIMTRFESALCTEFDKRPRVSELCATIGVPERTLSACCVKFFGLSPARYIRLRRLNLVRAELQRADPASASVAQIAQHYWFSELGRFATTYRALFGESPSATLRRARANSAGITYSTPPPSPKQ
jgi:AraC-like DNA-binding protein